MIVIEGVRIALWVLWNNKLRSLLTLLGNVVSVMSLVAVVSVIDGVNKYVKEKLADKGTGVFEVQKFNEFDFLTDPDKFVEALKNPDLTLRDVRVRGEALSAMAQLNRQMTHHAYHVGQIVFLAKHFRSTEWKNLSMPRKR